MPVNVRGNANLVKAWNPIIFARKGAALLDIRGTPDFFRHDRTFPLAPNFEKTTAEAAIDSANETIDSMTNTGFSSQTGFPKKKWL